MSEGPGPSGSDSWRFDPDKFLDREDALRRFLDLLEFRTDRRLLAILAAGGAGKSGLLHRFWWSCRFPDESTGEAPRPVSRVPLDQVKGGRVIDLVDVIWKDLDGLDWSDFIEVRQRWLSFDWTLVGTPRAEAQIDNREARISGSPVFIGQQLQIEQATVNMQSRWPDVKHEDEANGIYVEAFCRSLHRNAERQPVVILLDSFDRAPGTLQDWVEEFVHRHCLDADRRPAYLVVVLAGRDLPPYRARLRGGFERYVDLIERFEDWSDELVERFLHLKGFVNATPGEIALLREQINRGFPLRNVETAMGALRAQFSTAR